MELDDLKNLDISDIDFNNMGSWPMPAKAIMAALVFGVVIGVGYYLFVGDQTQRLVDIERKEVDFKKEFERKQAKAVNLEDYKRQMKTIQDSFKTLLQQLPKSSEMAGLVDEFSYAATGAGCEIIDVKFLPEVDSEFYAEKPIQIQVSGGYHQLADFISRVSRLPRIVTLHNFNITLGDGDVPSSPGEKLLLMSITAKTYRSDTEE
ncbi:type 4a pilus biogenesis protein PilO [Aliikangiella coralliicola]|uniref:Pilus assembly protein PilO n=1 Tax=Aliikangiella coralliicola TaxID=2592383 RepID=A0A545UHL8_9GAMM|nr:type 4a pilus biogenesis protein PilO [Aliikangiella coralliicola]TQV88948.1 pilus assembly protein PilO [Aliikangiella coralliicola]